MGNKYDLDVKILTRWFMRVSAWTKDRAVNCPCCCGEIGDRVYILRDDFSSLPLNCYCCSRRCRRQYLPWLQDLEIMVKVPSGGFKARKNDVLSPEASYGLLYHSIKAARRTLNRDQAKEGKRRDTRCAHWP